MVNTFIVAKRKGRVSYTKSAKLLDKRRLNKQITEAIQILDGLVEARIVAKHFGWKGCPKTESYTDSPKDIAKLFKQRCKWLKKTRKKYLSQSMRLVEYTKGEFTLVKKSKTPIKIHRTDKVTYKDDGIVKIVKASGKKYKLKKGEYVPFGHRVIGLGYAGHAASVMWVGYEESLKLYINKHIKVWKSYKTKSGRNCRYYTDGFPVDKSNLIHPWWIIHYDGVMYSHRACLLRKEISRQEDKWYVYKKSFTSLPEDVLKNSGYVWPSKLREDIIADLIKGEWYCLSNITEITDASR